VRRMRFDRSADRGVQEYRNADGGQREERRSRSTERRDWEADSNHESWDERRPRGSRGRGFSSRQGTQNFSAPQNFGPQSYGQGYGSPQNYGEMQNYSQTTAYGQVPTYEPQNYTPQNFTQPTPYYSPQQVPNYGPQNAVQPNYTIPVSQPAYTPPPPNMETGRNAGLTMQCGKCGCALHSHLNMCPAVKDNCHGCGLKGHFARVCHTTARLQQQQQSQ